MAAGISVERTADVQQEASQELRVVRCLELAAKHFYYVNEGRDRNK
jgi:hypothetical protein